MTRLFGTDGVRGVVNTELTVELALRIGLALAAWAQRKGLSGRVMLARDTRRSGEMLQAALAAGIAAGGLDPVDLGVLPTPGLAWCTANSGAAAGVMISASHNPPEYNGIKIVSSNGFKLSDEDEDWIERHVAGQVETGHDLVPAAQVGRWGTGDGVVQSYLDFLVSRAEKGNFKRPVVIDCGNGAGYRLAPRLLSVLGLDVTVINDQPDGININAGCGSTYPQVVAAAVKERGAAVGFSLDGDADRCIAVDELGNVVDGDAIIAITALYRQSKGRLPGPGVAATVMSNLGLELALRQAGISLYRTPVGDRHVLEEMQRRGLAVGGEQSGHIVFLDSGQSTGDGLLTMVEVLNVMISTGKPLSELAAVVKKVPQRMANIKAARAAEVMERPAVRDMIAKMTELLGENGRILVRPSGTEPVIRVMVEAVDEDLLSQVLQEATAVIEAEAGDQ